MDIFSIFKCVSCLLKTLKVLHFIKKAVCVSIALVIALVAFMGIFENKAEIKHLLKQVKRG